MATQLAPTPVLKGSDAKRALIDANRKPTQKTKQGAAQLTSMFDKIVKK